jgi:hypothetical protein
VLPSWWRSRLTWDTRTSSIPCDTRSCRPTAQLTPLKPKVGGAYASVFRCAGQKARISKSGLVKIEFARALNENEKEILKVRGFRESRSTRTWTYQSNSFYWGVEDLTTLVDDPTWTLVQSQAIAEGREKNGLRMPAWRGVLTDEEIWEAVVLEQLAEADILLVQGFPPDCDYRFKHALIQDAAYENFLKSPRQVLHRRVYQERADQRSVAAWPKQPRLSSTLPYGEGHRRSHVQSPSHSHIVYEIR